MNLTEIRHGLATRLNAVAGLDGKAFVPDSIATLTACVLPGDPYVDYWGTFGAERMATINLRVLILCPKIVDFAWQETLDGLCSTGTAENASVADVIHADATLAVVGLQCIVVQSRNWGTTTVGETAYGSIEFDVRAYINRS